LDECRLYWALWFQRGRLSLRHWLGRFGLSHWNRPRLSHWNRPRLSHWNRPRLSHWNRLRPSHWEGFRGTWNFRLGDRLVHGGSVRRRHFACQHCCDESPLFLHTEVFVRHFALRHHYRRQSHLGRRSLHDWKGLRGCRLCRGNENRQRGRCRQVESFGFVFAHASNTQGALHFSVNYSLASC